MRKVLKINGVYSSDYGIYIASDTYLNAPKIDYTSYPVPARNGDLLQYNRRLNNVLRHFVCFIPKNTEANLDGFKKLLYMNPGYVKLESDYDSGVYQYGFLAEELTAVPFRTGGALTATFDLYFSCKPEKVFTVQQGRQFSPSFGETYLTDYTDRLVRFAVRNANVVFPATNIGWTTSSFSGTALVSGGTYTVNVTSDSINVFALVGVDSLDPDNASHWTFYGATEGGSLTVKNVVEPTGYQTAFRLITTLQPKDMSAEVTYTGYSEGSGSFSISAYGAQTVEYGTESSETDVAVGCNPTVILRYYGSSNFGKNYFLIGNTFITVDLGALVEDLGQTFFLDNYTESNWFNVGIDLESMETWLSNERYEYYKRSFSMNNYVAIAESRPYGDSFEFRCSRALLGSTSPVSPRYIVIEPKWWKI